MTRVYIRHARKELGPNGNGYCVRGMRAFCERHNLDFNDFARNGIEAEKLLATGDAMAARIVEIAKLDGE